MGKKIVNKMQWTAVLLFCFIAGCFGFTANEIYESLSDDEKSHFFRFYLAKGFLDSRPTYASLYPGISFPDDLPIPSDLAQMFQTIEIEPEDFPVTLFNKFRTKFNLTAEETLQVARKRCKCYPKDKYLCMPDGTCVDIGDTGSVCCS